MGYIVKRVAVLGATGSIGRQTLEVIDSLPGHFSVIGLAGGRNTALLAEQIEKFQPRFVFHQETRTPPPTTAEYEFLSMEEMARHPEIDLVVIATSGKWGLKPTLAAVRAGKQVALANKESLVMAGELIIGEAKQHGAKILPVDSEHSAIWQCLEGETGRPSRIILTASGGPFRRYSPAELAKVKPEQALQHPSWRMGNKVTIDSATLMNKGLEVIEARWLFGMRFDSINVLIHPQSIVHSMVEFADGSVKAQLGRPDMRLPIQYALSYPERLANPHLPRLDWADIEELTFEPPDLDSFPCLRIAIEAGKKGETFPAALCGADEIAVQQFLAGRIKFTDIPELVERTLEEHKAVATPSLEAIMAADDWARERVMQLVGDKS
ncbi:MAG TPA: 1-deoxy-D-xylulose-5-phosphate reductoisomerase [Dehalococcoidales bacterium]|nr:1-deoxy-D-xylulose-5-phosphate reductoisomerase [Dehalococcoidales bacterium]